MKPPVSPGLRFFFRCVSDLWWVWCWPWPNMRFGEGKGDMGRFRFYQVIRLGKFHRDQEIPPNGGGEKVREVSPKGVKKNSGLGIIVNPDRSSSIVSEE